MVRAIREMQYTIQSKQSKHYNYNKLEGDNGYIVSNIYRKAKNLNNGLSVRRLDKDK